jgi:hypothetical protein
MGKKAKEDLGNKGKGRKQSKGGKGKDMGRA